MGFAEGADIRVVLLNLSTVEVTFPNFTSVAGDARNMPTFRDKEYDVVFSNSVIEHVGGFDQQRQMAEEVKRVGKRYFLQTPNRSFPIEPHFYVPFFQLLPLRLKLFLVLHFAFRLFRKKPDKQEAMEEISSIRTLTKRELRELFPEASIYSEKFLGLTKSFVVYGGWAVGSK